MQDLKFSITAQSENPTKTIVKARNFSFIIDEPKTLGGTDEGSNPVEYILGALAGCLNVIGHVVASEMNFSLKGIEIEIEGDLNPARFFGQSEVERAGYKDIRVIIKPEADVDNAILEEWLKKVKNRCPVSDNIANSTPISIALR